jgi:hypothetical protein
MNKEPLIEIARIDGLLDLNREMLIDAEKMKPVGVPQENERAEKVAKVKNRINALLDERLVYMKERG